MKGMSDQGELPEAYQILVCNMAGPAGPAGPAGLARMVNVFPILSYTFGQQSSSIKDRYGYFKARQTEITSSQADWELGLGLRVYKCLDSPQLEFFLSSNYTQTIAEFH